MCKLYNPVSTTNPFGINHTRRPHSLNEGHMQTWCYYRMSCCKSLAALFACFASCANNGTMSSMPCVTPSASLTHSSCVQSGPQEGILSGTATAKGSAQRRIASILGGKNSPAPFQPTGLALVASLHCLCYPFCFQFRDRLTLDVERILSI